jgi:hypothetical protein
LLHAVGLQMAVGGEAQVYNATRVYATQPLSA